MSTEEQSRTLSPEPKEAEESLNNTLIDQNVTMKDLPSTNDVTAKEVAPSVDIEPVKETAAIKLVAPTVDMEPINAVADVAPCINVAIKDVTTSNDVSSSVDVTPAINSAPTADVVSTNGVAPNIVLSLTKEITTITDAALTKDENIAPSSDVVMMDVTMNNDVTLNVVEVPNVVLAVPKEDTISKDVTVAPTTDKTEPTIDVAPSVGAAMKDVSTNNASLDVDANDVEPTKDAEPTWEVAATEQVESTNNMEPNQFVATNRVDATKDKAVISTNDVEIAKNVLSTKDVEPAKSVPSTKEVPSTKNVKPVTKLPIKPVAPKKVVEPTKHVATTKHSAAIEDDLIKAVDEMIRSVESAKNDSFHLIEASIQDTLTEIETILESEKNELIQDESIDGSMTDDSHMETRSEGPSIFSKGLTDECYVINLSGLPKMWKYMQVKAFIDSNLKSTSIKNNKSVRVNAVKDDSLIETGDRLIRFSTPEQCQQVYKELKAKNLTWERQRVIVKLDEGHVLTNQINKMKRAEKRLKKGELGGSQDELNEPPAKKKYEPAKYRFVVPKAYIASERVTMDTYGLSSSFLTSLGIRPPLKTRILVSSLDNVVDEEKLREVFSLAGQVRSVRMKGKGTPKSAAVVEFDHPVEAVQAISMFRGKSLYDRDMHIIMNPGFSPQQLPLGLKSIGTGLGFGGEPLRGVRNIIELHTVKEVLVNSEIVNNVASKNNSPFANPIGLGDRVSKPKPSNDSNPSDLLLGLSLVNAQSLLQQGSGNDLTSLLNRLQNQKANVLNPNLPQSHSNVRQMPANVPQTSDFPRPNVPRIKSPLTSRPQPQSFHQDMPAFNQNAPFNPNPNVPNFTPNTKLSPNFVQNTPNFERNTPNFNQNPNYSHNNQNYQQSDSNFKNALSYDQNAPNYNQNTPNYNQNPPSFNQNIQGNDWGAPLPPPPLPPLPVHTHEQVHTPVQDKNPHFESQATYYSKSNTSNDSKRRSYDKESSDRSKRSSGSDMLIFSNLPSSVTIQALNCKMREVGEIMFGEMTGQGRAIVRFKEYSDAKRCIKLFDRSKVDGQTIDVNLF